MNTTEVKRRAVLIGSPGSHNDYLPGIDIDLYNVEQFLLSEKGGSFYKTEIIKLYNPDYQLVAKEIQDSIAEYTFVYFSGHGFSTNNGIRGLNLKDKKISDLKLLNNSPRQLVIIDACRTFLPSISGISPDIGDEYSHFYGSPARMIFNDYIKQSPEGKVIVHATQLGEVSLGNTNGGVFTNELLEATNELPGTNYSGSSITTIVRRVQNKLLGKQIPEIAYRTGNLTVPFALKEPKITFVRNSQERAFSKGIETSKNSWVKIGLVGGLIALIIALSS